MKASILQRDRVESFRISTHSKPNKTIESRGNTKTQIHQFSLPVATPCKVAIAPVPLDSRLASDRHHITINQGEHCFSYGLQFTADEAARVYSVFADIQWQFDGDGRLDSAKLRQCDRLVQELLGGVA